MLQTDHTLILSCTMLHNCRGHTFTFVCAMYWCTVLPQFCRNSKNFPYSATLRGLSVKLRIMIRLEFWPKRAHL